MMNDKKRLDDDIELPGGGYPAMTNLDGYNHRQEESCGLET